VGDKEVSFAIGRAGETVPIALELRKTTNNEVIDRIDLRLDLSKPIDLRLDLSKPLDAISRSGRIEGRSFTGVVALDGPPDLQVVEIRFQGRAPAADESKRRGPWQDEDGSNPDLYLRVSNRWWSQESTGAKNSLGAVWRTGYPFSRLNGTLLIEALSTGRHQKDGSDHILARYVAEIPLEAFAGEREIEARVESVASPGPLDATVLVKVRNLPPQAVE
jgi:hypothetical protein